MQSKNRNFNLAVVGALLCITTCAISITPTHAANGWEIDLKGTEMVPTASSVAISISGSPSSEILNADKGIAQGMIKRTVNVEIGTTDGYVVSVKGDPRLTGAKTGQTVPSVALTLNNMLNQWGWYSANGNAECSPSAAYKAMTTSGTTIDSGTLSAKTTKGYTLCFGMKVNTAQVADTYSGSVTISAVAEPGLVATNGFNNITNMQDMTPNICKSAAVNTTAQLVDVRDGKKYWVTKLADGNCWMSQDLKLDLSTSKALTGVDSDMANNWTPDQNTITEINSTTLSCGAGDYNGTCSWNMGNYVMNTQMEQSPCENNGGLSSCSWAVNVEGWKASDDPNFYRKTNYIGLNGAKCTKAENAATNAGETTSDCRFYDAHYLVGHYYQWNAATANSGREIARNGNAESSICPRGWKMANESEGTRNGSFSNLLSQYGVSRSLTGAGSASNAATSGNSYNILLSPLFFMWAGYIIPGNSTHYQGFHATGQYWTSWVPNVYDEYMYQQADELRIYSAVQSMSDARYWGEPIRCVFISS